MNNQEAKKTVDDRISKLRQFAKQYPDAMKGELDRLLTAWNMMADLTSYLSDLGIYVSLVLLEKVDIQGTIVNILAANPKLSRANVSFLIDELHEKKETAMLTMRALDLLVQNNRRKD